MTKNLAATILIAATVMSAAQAQRSNVRMHPDSDNQLDPTNAQNVKKHPCPTKARRFADRPLTSSAGCERTTIHFLSLPARINRWT